MCLPLLCWHPMHPEPQSVCLIWRLRLAVCDWLIVHLKANCKGLHLAALQTVNSCVVHYQCGTVKAVAVSLNVQVQ